MLSALTRNLKRGFRRQKDKDMAKTKKETKPKAPKALKVAKFVEEVEDRSAFNCPACNGDGLISPTKVCENCLGTGKK